MDDHCVIFLLVIVEVLSMSGGPNIVTIATNDGNAFMFDLRMRRFMCQDSGELISLMASRGFDVSIFPFLF